MKNLNPLHHISLIESRGTNCAWIRIKYGNKSFQESFPFLKYGGKEKAIAAAKKRRDEQGKKIYGDNWPFTKQSPKRVSVTNTSGEIGVSYSSKDHAWVATWQANEDGKRKQRNAYYSIAKYGERKARKMAKDRRAAEVAKNKVVAA